MKIITVVAAVIRREGKVLLASRPASKPPLGWEFPGGKVEPGENFNAALRRELLEELGVDSGSGRPALQGGHPECGAGNPPPLHPHAAGAGCPGSSRKKGRSSAGWN